MAPKPVSSGSGSPALEARKTKRKSTIGSRTSSLKGGKKSIPGKLSESLARVTRITRRNDLDMGAVYEKTRAELVGDIKQTLELLSNIYSPDVRQFILVQDDMRKKYGCSKMAPIPSYTKDFAMQIQARNAAAATAKSTLASTLQQMKSDASIGSAAQKTLTDLATSILLQLGLNDSGSNEAIRAQYFPNSPRRSSATGAAATSGLEESPEDTLDVFLAMETVIRTVESATGASKRTKQASPSTSGQHLNLLFAELAHVLVERMRPGNSMAGIVDDTCHAFTRLETAEKQWHKGSAQNAVMDAKKQFKICAMEYGAAAVEAECAEHVLKCAAKKGVAASAEAKSKRDGHIVLANTAKEKLVAEQKAFAGLESSAWIVQRNYLPEIWHELHPTVLDTLEVFTESVDVSTDCSKSLTLAERTLAEYDDPLFQTARVISTTYRGKTSLLKRYNLAHKQDLKALSAELVMQKKLKTHTVARIASIFVDNSDCYLHYENGVSNLEQFIETDIFNNSAHSAVLLIRSMIHCVQNCHKQGVVVGDINSSWIVSTHGLPHLHDFYSARVVPNLPQKDIGEPLSESMARTFEPPEIRGARVNKIQQAWTMKCDVYALGKAISVIADAGAESMRVSGTDKVVSTLVASMCAADPSKRLSAAAALSQSDDLLATLADEMEAIQRQNDEIKDMANAISKAREELELARGEAKRDLTEVARIKKEMEVKQRLVEEKHKKLEMYAGEAADRAKLEETLKPPSYWSKSDPDAPISLIPIERKSPAFNMFRQVIKTDDPTQLNKGRDVTEKGTYSQLDLVGVWRVENPGLWRNYAVERGNIKSTITRRGLKIPKFALRDGLNDVLQKLPGFSQLFTECNETYLIHGTGPENILSITTNGVNERFTSAALFGKGSYFAEDIAKNDQYVRGDPVLGGYPELHRRLFPHGGEYGFPEYPYKAYYVALCRVVMGYPVRVFCMNAKKKQMRNIDFEGSPIFATTDERELASIPNVEPLMQYHSLVAEKGGDIIRFREMCQFHSARVYPEYLICYTRK
eukprot:GEMP01000722.1.p1 GENE.GEMP01000722.1~~GEMP01000722.1.p1  ORF type:complete len:1036 (+),score=254.44 GEMP01000722.1:216-3323(+)